LNALRILIAEDSSLFATVLGDIIEAEPDLSVVGVASDGEEAVEMCVELEPDLVVMDIQMPRMDGLTATERIMARQPTPILVVTSDPYRGGVDLSFKALSKGALDLVGKPSRVPMREADRLELIRKMRLLAQVPVVRHPRANLRDRKEREEEPAADTGDANSEVPSGAPDVKTPIIGIAASTGGPKALATLLGAIPADFPAPICVVQHITRGFSQHLTRWLDANSKLNVIEGVHGAPIKSGHVYIAPSEKQMEVTSNRYLKIYEGPAVAGHRPSGDVLFRSLARHIAPKAIGVILSGMGNDGTFGMAALYRTGSVTVVQDEASSVVYSMPGSARERGVVTEVVEIDDMATSLCDFVRTLLREDA
jgi:two-component system chemotaxis response regulator CheB